MKDEHLILCVLGGAAVLIAWNGSKDREATQESTRSSFRQIDHKTAKEVDDVLILTGQGNM